MTNNQAAAYSLEPAGEQHDILLATLNARYIHSAFGLRYLKANLAEYEQCCEIQEFTLESRPEDIVEQLLLAKPKIIGFGVYIWNVIQTEKVVALLKAVAPQVTVVLGTYYIRSSPPVLPAMFG